MKYFSTFTGIGGFELGIERAMGNRGRSSPPTLDERGGIARIDFSDGDGRGPNAMCVGYSEIDKYAIQTYERHFNHVNYGDITKLNPELLPDFDLICGGFPCQSFSVAGKRRGFEDTRGTLFFDLARILENKRPRHLVFENVKGLLSHDSGKTFQTILGVLTDLGYRVEWQVLNSKDFGVPQNRERIYIVGHLRGECGRKVFPICGADTKALGACEVGFKNADGLRPLRDTERFGTVTATYYKGVGAAGRPIVKQLVGGSQAQRVYSADGMSPTLGTMQGGNTQPKVVRQPLRFINRNQKNVAGDYAFTVDASQTSGLRASGKIRRLTPKECERLQGFPDDWTAGVSDTQRYKQCGNAVTVNTVAAVMGALKECLEWSN
jgi:DNA (cytosine-5)-methyltransferase 1